MGRPEVPVPAGPVGAMAQFLREARSRSGLTYQQMAARTRVCSAATLARAAGGRQIPGRKVLDEYVRLSGADPATAVRLWKKARKRQAAEPHARRHGPLDRVVTPGDLVAVMRAVRLAAGQPSLQELEMRARNLGLGPLATSTVNDILREKRPPSWGLVEAFVQACDVPAAMLPRWKAAWVRTQRGPGLDDIALYVAALLSGEDADAKPPRERGMPRVPTRKDGPRGGLGGGLVLRPLTGDGRRRRGIIPPQRSAEGPQTHGGRPPPGPAVRT
ncbi:helix-turn-helix domain-containing protein [Streptodolium elevatio]